MNLAKETLDKWLVDGNFKTYKELSEFLGVAQNTLDVWKQRGKIPEKHILKYTQLTNNTSYEPINILKNHIGDREMEIITAFRELSAEKQELFYHKIKAEAIEERLKNQSYPQIVAKYA